MRRRLDIKNYARTHNVHELPSLIEVQLASFDWFLKEGLGEDFVNYFIHIKRQELRRWSEAEDKADWQRREYFSRF